MYLYVIEQKSYRNWKKSLSQNILAAWNFNMKFTYRLARSKNLAYNKWVFNNKIDIKKFPILIGKYYFGDTRYFNLDYLLILYKDI